MDEQKKSTPASPSPASTDMAADQKPMSPATPVTGGAPKNNSMMRMMAIVLAAVVVLGGGTGFALYWHHRSVLNAPVKVGIVLPFSGDASAAGFGEVKGIELAQKQLGATKIDLVREDTKCDSKLGAAAVKKLAAENVVAMIGDACSSGTAGEVQPANDNKIVLISPSASSPSLSKPGDYFFRVVPPDEFQGSFAAQLMYDKGIRKVAMLYSNEPYGKGLSSVLKQRFEALGGTVVSDLNYEDGSIDLSKQAAATVATKPDAVYFLGISGPSVIAGLQQLRAAGLTAPIYSGDSADDPIVIGGAGAAAEGMTVTAFPVGSQSFKQALADAYPSDEQVYGAAQGYDAFKAIYQAYQQGARTGEQFKEKLSNMSFTGVSGSIAFDKNGEISNTSYKYDTLVVKNGNFVTSN
ncbi:MAG TPA: branched-chain amino acid ABC transporter substrate-binding protein [Candidatus Saccharimonadales bacterium]|nr:branched-chain amino acid ABC transporter substrate-binding protein [Candidatus Saccharimonadales bacterium]